MERDRPRIGKRAGCLKQNSITRASQPTGRLQSGLFTYIADG